MIPEKYHSLRETVVLQVVQELTTSYIPSDVDRIRFRPLTEHEQSCCHGTGSASWTATACVLDNLQELVMPGIFVTTPRNRDSKPDVHTSLKQLIEDLYTILISYFLSEEDESQSEEKAALAAFHLVAQLPRFRSHATWNIFASLKDPALWDTYILHNESRRRELGKLDLIEIIDQAIEARDPARYVSFLCKHGFEYAVEYQQHLVKRAYSGWRALLMHDIAHTLALGSDVEMVHDPLLPQRDERISPTPFLPRVIAEQAASLYQTDLHPETIIGDANFLDHPHRGITTGQTGKIGMGCVIYPCTLGGITDKVKPRHPLIGNYVLIGTDVGIFGPVVVADHAVIGANTEINGMVEIRQGVRIRAAVVARTVISESGLPGRIIFGEGVVVGEECLVINDQPTDLIIPAGTVIPAGGQVTNAGNGEMKVK
jgi:serine acetyltransferase